MERRDGILLGGSENSSGVSRGVLLAEETGEPKDAGLSRG